MAQRWPRVSRITGTLLMLLGILVIFFEAFASGILPPPEGLIAAEAVVINRNQRGTFQEPTFYVTLAYTVRQNGETQELRSGQQVDYVQYRALAVDDRIAVHYRADDPYKWYLVMDVDEEPDDYAPGIFLIAVGLIALLLPNAVWLAVRQDDFDNLGADNGQNT